ncbi:MAG TPA: heparan-alpha-glucosaminide N-acetyltransferase domain-containing protein [Kofleriaceae bacterium]|nr:heparan-alpha-glucosaminide N-acetyltransferase domain-containing protein [Kofleriaceae bacterium]
MASAAPTTRAHAIDAVRGAVVLIMALDHVRDFLGNAHFDATDLGRTTVPLFLSRWITHFCAPTFFLLAGASAYLAIRGGRRTVRGAARFLAVRGAALIVIEQTALRCLGWYFHADYHFMNAGVLYGLGGAMILLAGMVWLPPRASLGLGLAIILGEAGVVKLGDLGAALALVTQSRDFEPARDYHFFVSYPPIPWFGVMAFGYGMADLVYGNLVPRRRPLLGFALGGLAVLVVLRALDLGDATPWTADHPVLSLVNVNKYPPSTPFLLLTLGGTLLAWYACEHARPISRPRAIIEVYGRAPLFFYLLHIPLIHLLAVVYANLAFGTATWLTSGPVIFWDVALPGSPPDYGFALPIVWLIWAAFVAAMYPACRWYVTRRRGSRAAPSAA